jgi:hypothetical protein
MDTEKQKDRTKEQKRWQTEGLEGMAKRQTG